MWRPRVRAHVSSCSGADRERIALEAVAKISGRSPMLTRKHSQCFFCFALLCPFLSPLMFSLGRTTQVCRIAVCLVSVCDLLQPLCYFQSVIYHQNLKGDRLGSGCINIHLKCPGVFSQNAEVHVAFTFSVSGNIKIVITFNFTPHHKWKTFVTFN